MLKIALGQNIWPIKKWGDKKQFLMTEGSKNAPGGPHMHGQVCPHSISNSNSLLSLQMQNYRKDPQYCKVTHTS